MGDQYSGDEVRWYWLGCESGCSVSVPPLHGPLLRAGDPDVMVVDLVLVVQGAWDVRHGKCPGGWDQGCHFWAPRNVLLGHIPPSPPSILGYHHGIRSPRSP